MNVGEITALLARPKKQKEGKGKATARALEVVEEHERTIEELRRTIERLSKEAAEAKEDAKDTRLRMAGNVVLAGLEIDRLRLIVERLQQEPQLLPAPSQDVELQRMVLSQQFECQLKYTFP